MRANDNRLVGNPVMRRFGHRRFGAQLAQVPESMKPLVPSAMTKVDMAGDMFLIDQTLRRWASDSFSVEAHVYPEESHESIMGAAFSRGLRRLYGTL